MKFGNSVKFQLLPLLGVNNCSDQTQTLKKGGPTHLDLEGGDSLKNQEGLANS